MAQQNNITTITTYRTTLRLVGQGIEEIPDKVIITILLIIALFTRTYGLGEFPYFPPQWPYLGDKTWAPGMYRDEAVYLNLALNLFNKPTTYQPWLQLLLVHLSTQIFGATVFAARLPSAVFSSLNAPLIYLIAKKFFNSKVAAVISAFYYIVMTPALIYNRMLFLENGVSFFFMLTILLLTIYEEKKMKKWFYATVIASGLAISCKINGLIVPIYMIVYILQNIKKEHIVKYALIGFIPVVLIFATIITLRTAYIGDFLGALTIFQSWWIGMIGREMSLWQYLVFESMPSGVLIYLFPGYFKLEYWYILSLYCAAYLAIKDFDRVKNILLAMLIFISVTFMFWGIGSYYLTIIQPIMAIPVGYAFIKMIDMKPFVNLVFTCSVYTPLIATIIPYLPSIVTRLPEIDYIRYIYKLALAGVPLTFSVAGTLNLVRLQKIINIVIIMLTLISLFMGSYIINALYPHYFSLIPP